MKYLILGHKGQLGKEFVRYMQLNEMEHYGFDIDEVDICSREKVHSLINDLRPGVIVNCAAYNQVDASEQDPGPAFAANADAVRYIAEAAERNGSFVVHYSSDYVFDGEKTTGLYKEKDEPNPINNYGNSKLQGERNLRDITPSHLIFRLSWIYGFGTQSFVFKFLNWIDKQEILKIASDEVSVPTYTKTIVDVTMKALKKGASGLYHLTNSGYASRYEVAKEILKILGKGNILYPVQRESFNLPAKRPYFSAMSNHRVAALTGGEIPVWQDDLKLYLTS